MDDYCLLLDYSPKHLLDMMYEEASRSENYYLSPVNVLRCDVSKSLRTELTKIINVPFADCGFLKTAPMQTYPVHIDKFRISAINMPLFEDVEGFESFVITGKGIESINYKRNQFTLLNVMKPHGVENKNLEKERIILSIGVKNNPYDELILMHKKGTLINAIL